MTTLPVSDEQDPDAVADSEANAMKDQLRKDVASWRGARADGTATQSDEFRVAAVKQPAPQATPRVRRPKAAQPVAPAAPVQKKPFSMAYDGVSEADYITYMIARGAR